MEDLAHKRNRGKLGILKIETTDLLSQTIPVINILSDIAEEPFEIDEDETPISLFKKQRYRNNLTKKIDSLMSPKIPLILPPIDKTELFYHTFLAKISDYPQIYQDFKEKAFKNQVLSHSKTPINQLNDSFSFRETPRLAQKTIEVYNIDPFSKSRKMTMTDRRDQSIEVMLNTPQHKNEMSKSRNESLKSIRQDYSHRGSSRGSSTTRTTKKLRGNRYPLDRTSQSLIEIFSKMSKNPESHRELKISSDTFKEYTSKRYPSEMVEIITKSIIIEGNQNLEGWVAIIEKFINLSDDKILRFCFELFDFNKDKYLCTHDAYHAISLNQSNLYDQDIIRIREAMMQKQSKKGNINKKPKIHARRGSNQSSNEEETKKIPYIHPTKPEAITVDDFVKISFIGKPQIFQDLVQYLTGFNINYSLLKPESSYMNRKLSEDIIFDMRYKQEMRETYMTDPRYNYFVDLDRMMQKYETIESQLLLEKFEMLKCPSYKKNKMISMKSTVEVFPNIFGFKCDYISKRFYGILAGPNRHDITKISYMTKLLELFKAKPVDQNKFAFELYDRNNDGVLTCDEVNEIYEALPPDTPIYEECQM